MLSLRKMVNFANLNHIIEAFPQLLRSLIWGLCMLVSGFMYFLSGNQLQCVIPWKELISKTTD